MLLSFYKLTIEVVALGLDSVRYRVFDKGEDAHRDDGQQDEEEGEAPLPLEGQEVLLQKHPEVGCVNHKVLYSMYA